MDQYTDDERVEDLKKWWKENGASIIVGITLGVVAIFGWRYWNSYRDAKGEQASQAYDAFIVAVEKPDADQARQRNQSLLADFPKSPYASLAAMRLAKLASDSGDGATAIQQLEWVIENAKLDELKDIARLRLARLLFGAGRASDAEQQLTRVTTTSLTAEREELRGDLALAANDPAKARTAYTAALAASGGSSLLQLKLDGLSAPTAEDIISAPTVPIQPEPVQPPAITPPATSEPAAIPQTPAEATITGSASPETPPIPSLDVGAESAVTPPATSEPVAPPAAVAPVPAAASEPVPAPAPPTPTSSGQ